MTPRELTRELLVTAGNVTGIVDRLAALGLVERRPVPEDGRAVRVRPHRRGAGASRAAPSRATGATWSRCSRRCRRATWRGCGACSAA